MLCPACFIIVWQSALSWQSTLSGGYFTSVTECSVWEVFYYCGRVLCLGGMFLVWQSALSEGYLIVWQSALSDLDITLEY